MHLAVWFVDTHNSLAEIVCFFFFSSVVRSRCVVFFFILQIFVDAFGLTHTKGQQANVCYFSFRFFPFVSAVLWDMITIAVISCHFIPLAVHLLLSLNV